VSLASGLPKINADALFIFPLCAKNGKRKIEVMKVLKQILFTFALLIGIAITASAQSGNNQPKKPPPKPPPPVVKVPDEKKPPPRDDKKKPGMAWVMVQRESDLVLV
jgi:hypothetical protein